MVTDEYPEDLPVEHTKDTLLSKPCLCKVDILVTLHGDLINGDCRLSPSSVSGIQSYYVNGTK